MAVVGRAEVVVTALKNKFRESLNEEFRASEGDADKAGARVGSRFSNAAGSESGRFIDGLDMSPLAGKADAAGKESGGRFSNSFETASKRFVEGLDTSPLAKKMDSAGEDSGRRFGTKFDSETKRFIEGLDTNPLAGKFEESGNQSGLSFMSRLKSRLSTALDDRVLGDIFRRAPSVSGDAGELSASNFTSRFSNGMKDLDVESANIGRTVTKNLGVLDQSFSGFGDLAPKIIALVPLVGVLGGGLAALVGGATSMAAAFTFAAGSSAILATALSALGAGFVTGFLALSGIGNALKAMTNAQANAAKEAVAAAKAQRAAARQVQAAHDAVAAAALRVQRAERELARAQRDVARQAVTDARAVQDAERKLADAQQAATLAQRGLTAAREDAKEKLEQLQLQERGAVIGEEEATLRLRQARAAYTKTLNDSSATSDDKEQARLDLENAELALDQAKDTREDVTKQTNEANKAGIEGSKDVTDAKQKITDANRNVADAERGVADARRKQADDAVDGAQRIADAQQSVTDALHEQQRANQRLKDAEDDARHAADDFSASAIKLKKAMDALSPSAQKFAKYLFSLQPVLKQLKDAAGANLFGPLTIAIQTIKDGFLPTFQVALKSTGGALGEFARQLAHGLNVKDFKENFKALAAGNVVAFGLMGHALADVFRGFIGLARAAQPLFIDFLKWAQHLTHAFAAKFEGQKNIDHMASVLKHMGKDAAQVGQIFGAAFGSIGNIFKAALLSGEDLNGSLLTTLQTFQKWTGSDAGKKRMQEFFKQTAKLAKEVGHGIVVLVKEFLKLGENKSLPGIFKDIREGLPHLGHAISVFTTEIAPPAIKVIVALVKAFERFVNSSFFKTILNIFKDVAKAATTVAHGFRVLSGWIGDVKDKIAGVLPSPVITAFKDLGTVFSAAGTAVKILVAGLVALAIAYKALKKIGKVTGVTPIVNQVRSGFADPRTDRAKGAKGIGAFIQGARGNVITRDKKLTDLNGNRREASFSDRRLGNKVGDVVTRRSRARNVVKRRLDDLEYDPTLGTEEEFNEENARRQAARARAARTGKTPKTPGRFSRRLRAVTRRGGSDSSGFLDVSKFNSRSTRAFLGDAEDEAQKTATDEIRGTRRAAAKARVQQHAPKLKAGARGSAKAIAGAAVLETGMSIATGDLDPKNFVELGKHMGDALSGAAKVEIQDKLVEHGFEGFSKLHTKLAKTGTQAGEKAGAGIIKGLGSKLAQAGTATKGATTALKNLGTQAAEAAGKYAKLGVQALISAGKFLAVKTAQVAIAAATKAWAVVQWLLDAALDANPIGLIIIGIAALVAGIILAYKHSETFRKIVKGALDGVKIAFSAMWKIVEPIIGFFKKHLELLLLAFGPLGIAIAGVITIFKNWGAITQTVGRIFDDVVGFFTKLPGRIGDAIGSILSSLGSQGARIGKAIWNGITGAFGSIVNFIATPINIILDALRGMLKGLGKLKINIFGHKFGFPDWSGAIPDDINISKPVKAGPATTGASPTSPGRYMGAATGATVMPRPGGTLLRIAEGGRPESVVDTGLINARLRAGLSGDSRVSAELARQTELLRQIADHAGFSIENVNLTPHPDERAEQSVPRVLRDLAWQMGT